MAPLATVAGGDGRAVGQGRMEPIREAVRRLSRLGHAAKELALPVFWVGVLGVALLLILSFVGGGDALLR